MPCTWQSHWPLFAGSGYWFWCGDGTGPGVDGVSRHSNAYGKVQRLPGQRYSDKAKESTFAWNSCDLISGLEPCLALDQSSINQDS